MSTKLPHVAALDKAKIALMSRKDSAFFTSLCLSMRHRWDDTIPTACTDGTEILYSPKFFMSLDREEQVFLLLHETLHVAYDHMRRLMLRDKFIWNRAADHVINLQLIERGFKMPDRGLADTRFAGMGAEQVYNILFREHQEAGCPQPGKDLADLQDLRPLPKSVDPVKHAQEVKEILVRAALRSKQEKDKPGSIPGDFEILLDEILNPRLPWQTILQRWLQEFTKNDYSWSRRNRRYAAQRLYLPSLHSPRLINFTAAIDTSGSVSDEDFKAMVGSIAHAFKLCQPEEISLIQFDTEIKSVTKIRSLRDLMRCKFTGRGGTDITPVIKWANTHKPQLLMVFTDGDFRWPLEQYNPARSLWLIHNDRSYVAPYGKTVNYEMP